MNCVAARWAGSGARWSEAVSQRASPADIAAASAALRRGELVVMPTETVYGLAADAADPLAVGRIYALKGRPPGHPLIVHLASAAQLDAWARDIPDVARRLAAAFWPGPLTLVLWRSAQVPDAVTGGQDSVALRSPAHPVAQALLHSFGGGLAAPSANRYGHISPTRATHVRAEFGAQCPLVLDGGDCEVGVESTILSCMDGRLRILRPGGISRAQLQAVVGEAGVVEGGSEAPQADVPRVPGSTLAHYAPQTPLLCLDEANLLAQWHEAQAQGRRVGVLARRGVPSGAHEGSVWLEASHAPDIFARHLYADLRRLDAAGCDRLLVQAVPAAEAWDAVRDRLQRAAAGHKIAGFPPPGQAGMP